MFEDKFKKNLKEDEQLIRVVRKYPLVFFWPWFFSALFIIASFFFLYPLFRLGPWGAAGFAALLLTGLFLAVRALVVYSFNAFIITDQRIIDIDQRGFFDRTVSEITYDNIQDVSFRIKGLWQTFLRYGSVFIQTAAVQANIELHSVAAPEKIQQLIIDCQREYRQNNQPADGHISELISQLKDNLTKEDNQPPKK